MSKNQVAKFTLKLNSKKYKGEHYHELVGSVIDGANTMLVTISCDADGKIKHYTSEKGDQFIYARAVKFRTENREKKKYNSF